MVTARAFSAQTSIVLGYSFYSIQMNLLSGGPQGLFPPAVYIVDQIFNADHLDMLVNGTPKALPATLDWIISNSTCLTNILPPPNVSVTTAIAKTPLPMNFMSFENLRYSLWTLCSPKHDDDLLEMIGNINDEEQ